MPLSSMVSSWITPARGSFFFVQLMSIFRRLFFVDVFLSLPLSFTPSSHAALSRPPSLPDVAAVPLRTRPQRTMSRPSSYSSGLGDIVAERRNSASGSGGNGNAAGGGTAGAATGANAGGKPARTRPTNNQLL